VHREVRGLRVVAYDIPEGCCAGYYPECNPLIPLWHHAKGSKVPAAKAVPVRVEKVAAQPGDIDAGAREHRLGAAGRELTTDLTTSARLAGGQFGRLAQGDARIPIGLGLIVGGTAAFLLKRRRQRSNRERLPSPDGASPV
jgi:hypothetical protein